MAKKEIRRITASEDVAGLIDRGAEIDTELKNLSYQDKGHKSKLTKFVEGQLEEGEISLRIKGNKSAAVISASEKYSFNVTGDEIEDEVVQAAEKGIFGGVVKIGTSIHIPPADLARAVEVLNEAGIAASMSKSYSIDGKAYREFSDEGSPEVAAVKSLLDECVSKTTTFRVKYES
jgi:hypothetical protein